MEGKISSRGGFSSGSNTPGFSSTAAVRRTERDSADAAAIKSALNDNAVQVTVSQTARAQQSVDAVQRDIERSRPSAKLDEARRRKEALLAAETAPQGASSEAAASDTASPVYTGSYRDGVAIFDAVALKVNDDGSVDGTLYLPDGSTIQGRGTRDREGKIQMTFEDGNRYEGMLRLEGNTASLSEVAYLGNVEDQAQAPEAPAEFYGVAKGSVIAFDGMLMNLDSSGGVEVELFAGDGQRMSGKGSIAPDGVVNVRFENGDSYRARLDVRSSDARLSEVEFLASGDERQ